MTAETMAALEAKMRQLTGEDHGPSFVAEPRFAATWCSNCGRSFGPGEHGFSHCESHRHLRGTP